MTNPWLEIPLADYEGHMALPEVAQSTLLADLFEKALRTHTPASVAIFGCAGGNGFDRIDPQVTTRIVGIDINPDYIVAARERYGEVLPGLNLIVADLQMEVVTTAPVDLIFAALVFEYVESGPVLKRVRKLLNRGGSLVTIVQIAASDRPPVTASPFTALQSLSPCMQSVSPKSLRVGVAAHGLAEVASERVTSTGGKSFQVQTFTHAHA